jgi:hypothetical protein
MSLISGSKAPIYGVYQFTTDRNIISLGTYFSLYHFSCTITTVYFPCFVLYPLPFMGFSLELSSILYNCAIQIFGYGFPFSLAWI